MAVNHGSIAGNAKARRLGHLDKDKTVIFVCDVQDKFKKAIPNFDLLVTNAERLLKVARLLDIPIIATEQNPKVLSNLLMEESFLIKYTSCYRVLERL